MFLYLQIAVVRVVVVGRTRACLCVLLLLCTYVNVRRTAIITLFRGGANLSEAIEHRSDRETGHEHAGHVVCDGAQKKSTRASERLELNHIHTSSHKS